MYTYETQVRVRYAETDQMAYVYYGNYATYYEVARVEALRHVGFLYSRLEEQGVLMPVLELHCRYIQPARYDDLLTIRVSIPKLPAARIIFDYEIYNEAQVLLNTGQTTLVFVDQASKRLLRCPQELLTLFEPYFAS
ncbi:MAG: thioesterase family protein [Microscillaceae bacterium]|nr:thioesterase family protein [Microscillaceae bacterium]